MGQPLSTGPYSPFCFSRLRTPTVGFCDRAFVALRPACACRDGGGALRKHRGLPHAGLDVDSRLLARGSGDAWRGLFVQHGAVDAFTGFYFSFITLSTVGYGDITPVSQAARCLAAMEAMTGLLYVAVLIARLASLYSSGKSNEGV
jgi:hypothetical protein